MEREREREGEREREREREREPHFANKYASSESELLRCRRDGRE